jgi:hypothetical protein
MVNLDLMTTICGSDDQKRTGLLVWRGIAAATWPEKEKVEGTTDYPGRRRGEVR